MYVYTTQIKEKLNYQISKICGIVWLTCDIFSVNKTTASGGNEMGKQFTL